MRSRAYDAARASKVSGASPQSTSGALARSCPGPGCQSPDTGQAMTPLGVPAEVPVVADTRSTRSAASARPPRSRRTTETRVVPAALAATGNPSAGVAIGVPAGSGVEEYQAVATMATGAGGSA